MKYRHVGNTGLQLSEIGFGCGGNAGLMIRGSTDEQIKIVAKALEPGINYFDNSPDYGGGAAEQNLGYVLQTLKHRPFLNSKIEVRRENLDDIAGHVVRSAEASLGSVSGLTILTFSRFTTVPSLCRRSWRG